MSENKKVDILLVEDSEDLQDLTKELLESEGYQVHCVSNGLEALEAIQKKKLGIDLILLDLRMPVMDGYQFRKLQLLDPAIKDIPVVVMTADGNASAKAAELKVKDFINKAIGVESLLEIVRRNAHIIEK